MGVLKTPSKGRLKMANYALRVPESLFEYARGVAEEEKVSMNQFFVTAIAE
jgi:predicted HicB family RNase H-like nuclease